MNHFQLELSTVILSVIDNDVIIISFACTDCIPSTTTIIITPAVFSHQKQLCRLLVYVYDWQLNKFCITALNVLPAPCITKIFTTDGTSFIFTSLCSSTSLVVQQVLISFCLLCLSTSRNFYHLIEEPLHLFK